MNISGEHVLLMNICKKTTNGMFYCSDRTKTYCVFQCMFEQHDISYGTVYDDCKCNISQEYTESNLTLPSQCYSPSGTDCSWYQHCLERKYQCNGTENNFAVKFATKFCNLYSRSNQDFSQDGQKWMDAVRKCLQVSLVKTIRPYLHYSCKDVNRIAFDSHTQCYVYPDLHYPSISICNLGAADYFSVFWTIQSSKVMSIDSSRRTMKRMFETLKGCSKSFLKGMSFDGPIRLLKMKLKYSFPFGSRHQLVLDDNTILLNDFVDSIAAKLHWKENGVLWFLDLDINSTVTETYIDIYLTNRNVYDLNARNTTVPSNLNTTINEMKQITETRDIKGHIGGLSIMIISLQGCLDANCDTLLFDITSTASLKAFTFFFV
ncbi:Hypothetical predicted protein [Mytilus galloprovincialis]|uniref:Uncharacterized protein n=1 Tax=Mytilus galloprovincialis TaxID=29158 RepID=A0A8B6BHN5_MYTGA|nr:Hypothetical predicted protein [Mytilus galloprovincialis]